MQAHAYVHIIQLMYVFQILKRLGELGYQLCCAPCSNQLAVQRLTEIPNFWIV